MTLTNEGGRLKRDMMLVDGKDFKLVPDLVWKALSTWYGGSPALPRTVSVLRKMGSKGTFSWSVCWIIEAYK